MSPELRSLIKASGNAVKCYQHIFDYDLSPSVRDMAKEIIFELTIAHHVYKESINPEKKHA